MTKRSFATKSPGRSVFLTALPFLTPHLYLTVSLCCFGLSSSCSCELPLGACYPTFYVHHAGSVQVIKQKTSFHYCCCFYCAIAMSFITALPFLWGIISGNLDQILWLTLEKVIKSWEPKMFLCCFHQTSFSSLKNAFLVSDLFPDLGKISSWPASSPPVHQTWAFERLCPSAQRAPETFLLLPTTTLTLPTVTRKPQISSLLWLLHLPPYDIIFTYLFKAF